jgi:hypothetical protein
MIPAEYFDIFGTIGFAILLYIGMSLRKKEKNASRIIIIISTIGLLIDLYVVINKFIFGG